MYIIIQKESGENKFEYPGDKKLFTKQFINPTNDQQLIAENNSGKTLTQLSSTVSYIVAQYTGAAKQDRTHKYISTAIILSIAPIPLIRKLRKIIKDGEPYASDNSATSIKGDKANIILETLLSKTTINVNDPLFDSSAAKLLSWSLITQDEIDIIKAL